MLEVNDKQRFANAVLETVRADLPKRYASFKAVLKDWNESVYILAYDKNGVERAMFIAIQQSYPEYAIKTILKVKNRFRRFSYFNNGQPNVNCVTFKDYEDYLKINNF